MLSTAWSSRLLIHSSASSKLLLIPSSVFFLISFILFFIYDWSFLYFVFMFYIVFPELSIFLLSLVSIFIIITLHQLDGLTVFLVLQNLYLVLSFEAYFSFLFIS